MRGGGSLPHSLDSIYFPLLKEVPLLDVLLLLLFLFPFLNILQVLDTQGVSPRFFLKSANRNAAAQPPSKTKYSQVFIGVPGSALDLGGVIAIGRSAMADGRVPRFAEIPGNPQLGAC